MKKLFLLIFFKITLVEAKEKNFILAIINNEPITNIDVINEAKYLAALNPKIQELDKKKNVIYCKRIINKRKNKKK